MRTPRLDNQLCFALYAASRAAMQVYQPVLEPLGITYPQYLVLLVLWERDAVSVKRLGERLQLDSGTLTPLLKRMEAQQLLTRSRDTDDERVVRIQLSDAGRRLRSRAARVQQELLCKAQLPLSELSRLRDELHQLTQTLRGHAAEPTPA